MNIKQENIDLVSYDTSDTDKEKLLREIDKLKLENIDLKNELNYYADKDRLQFYENRIEELQKQITDLEFYKWYYNAVFASTDDEAFEPVYFNNLKFLYDEIAFEDDDKLNEKAIPMKYELLSFAMYLVRRLRDDEFYSVIMKHLIANAKKDESLNLGDYEDLSKLPSVYIDTVLNNKLLTKIVNGEVDNETYIKYK